MAETKTVKDEAVKETATKTTEKKATAPKTATAKTATAKAEKASTAKAAAPKAVKETAPKAKKSAGSKGQVKVTLIKSTIGCSKKQKATVEALGLKKIRSEKIHNLNDCIQGMINIVKHLVTVEVVK